MQNALTQKGWPHLTMSNKSKFPVSKNKYYSKIAMGYELEFAIRFGFSYDQSYKELSIYIGPFRFWIGK